MAYLSPVIPGLDLSYTYSPLRPLGNLGVTEPNPGTLWDFLNEHADFKIFRHIVETARMEGLFNDPSSTFTVFLPLDRELLQSYSMNVFKNIDQSTAMGIVNFSTLLQKVSIADIQNSSCLKMNTRLRGQDLYLKTTREGTSINGDVKILRPDVMVNNAIVHITSDLCKPVLDH